MNLFSSKNCLGSESFRKRYNVPISYYAGAMYKGIASEKLVSTMANSQLLSFYGSGGFSVNTLRDVYSRLSLTLKDKPYGVNFLHHPYKEKFEEQMASLIIEFNIQNIEASAFIKPVKSLIWLRASSFYKDGETIRSTRNLIVKLSRPDIALEFLQPPPDPILQELVEEGKITREQAYWSSLHPIASDLCVEADSGGHTDNGILHLILPAITRVRDIEIKKYPHIPPVHIGVGGGIGSPLSAAMAFMLGADFVVTGSINQCTVEAGTSDKVKDMLQLASVNDMALAPAGDMFELGAKVQVLKKGTLFPSRASLLHQLYSRYSSIEEIETSKIQQLERNYFGESINAVWHDTMEYYGQTKPDEIELAEKSKKHKMALLFKSYFAKANKWAVEGNPDKVQNYQIHCGPSMGVFNLWLKDSLYEDWRHRHADELALKLMEEAEIILKEKARKWSPIEDDKLTNRKMLVNERVF